MQVKGELRWENYKNLQQLKQKVSDVLHEIDQAAISKRSASQSASLTGLDYLIDAILSATS